MNDASKFAREELVQYSNPNTTFYGPTIRDLAAFALSLLARAEKAEKRMQSWGCPDSDNICLVCGRDAPCMTEAELKPGDPGIPCTFDMTFQEMIALLHLYEDRARKAEREIAALPEIASLALSLAHEFEVAVASREPVRGMQASPSSDFLACAQLPSAVNRMAWWAREIRKVCAPFDQEET